MYCPPGYINRTFSQYPSFSLHLRSNTWILCNQGNYSKLFLSIFSFGTRSLPNLLLLCAFLAPSSLPYWLPWATTIQCDSCCAALIHQGWSTSHFFLWSEMLPYFVCLPRLIGFSGQELINVIAAVWAWFIGGEVQVSSSIYEMSYSYTLIVSFALLLSVECPWSCSCC